MQNSPLLFSPLLFLDIDGVLHPASPTADPFTRLPLLEAWLRARPIAGLVITSSWRLQYPLDQLLDVFSEDLRPRMIGATPDLGAWGPGHRGREVLAWLERTKSAHRPWRALDDKPLWFDFDLHDRLIACDPLVGLTDHQVAQLDVWAATWCTQTGGAA